MLLQRTITETMLASPAGHPHRIMVSAPQGGEPKGGYPVIYVLDGDGWMGAAVEIAKMREYEKLDPAIIVGIGYPSHSFFDAIGRSYDFTPPNSADPDFEGIPLGGANDFLDFLNTTVNPGSVPITMRIRSAKILFGHSMGGLFALYTLYKAPESFAVYIAASPDLPFSNHIFRKLEPAFESNPAYRKPRVLVTVGELEGGESPALMDDYRRYYTAHPETHLGETVEQVMTETLAAERRTTTRLPTPARWPRAWRMAAFTPPSSNFWARSTCRPQSARSTAAFLSHYGLVRNWARQRDSRRCGAGSARHPCRPDVPRPP